MEQYLNRLKLSEKILLTPKVIVGLLVIFAICSSIGLLMNKMSLDDIFQERFASFQNASEVTDNAQMVQGNLYKLTSWAFSSYDPKKIEKLANEQLESLKKVNAFVGKISEIPSLSSDEKVILADLQKHMQEYSKTAIDVIDLAQSDLNTVTMFMATIDEKYLVVEKDLLKLSELEKNLAQKSYEQARKSFYIVILLSLVSLIIAIVCSYWITMRVSSAFLRPIDKTIDTIEIVSKGDLTKRVDVLTQDEIGTMAKQFNEFINKLQSSIGSIVVCTQKLTESATRLHGSSQNMANGASQVANQVTTVAAAGEEMASTSMEIAHNCKTAAQNANQVLITAQGSKGIVDRTLVVMKEIENNVNQSSTNIELLGQKSDQIGAIIKTIKDIADQTNLLALNAAIEAARAGKHGRGFAVVADEVRALAERTAQATAEISNMIESIQAETHNATSTMAMSVKKVSEGSVESSKSADALNEIALQIATVVDQVNTMANSASEQTRATKDISTNIQAITSIVEESASGAKEVSFAANELSKLAEELDQLVEYYKIS